jgi:hypothetical protein
LKQLVHEGFDLELLAGRPLFVEIFFEIKVKELENQVQFIFAVDNVFELHNVWVSQLLEERNLSNGCRRNALIGVLEPNFLKSDDLVCFPVASFEDDAIGAFAKFFMSFKSQVTLLSRDHFHITRCCGGLLGLLFVLGCIMGHI